jgi:hypothetical protein
LLSPGYGLVKSELTYQSYRSWLVLPFLAGASRASRGGVRMLRFAAALVAVGGFLTATGDPTGNGHDPVRLFTSAAGAVFLTVVSHLPWFLGAMVSGPLYALLGHRWRLTRSWPLALAGTVPVMLEPAMRWGTSSSGILFWGPYAPAAWAEALVGLALTAAAITFALRSRIGALGYEAPRRAGTPVRARNRPC